VQAGDQPGEEFFETRIRILLAEDFQGRNAGRRGQWIAAEGLSL
jgi:hypothetical protein